VACASDIFITDPLDVSVLDVSVLDPTDIPVLTLITCYPFYYVYVRFAPDRYIIRATPKITDDSSRSSASAQAAVRAGAR
jgi:sortase A